MALPERKRAVFNWSGGKDSALALKLALESGEYEIISLLTTVNRDSRRSTMHAIPESVLLAQAESIGLPLCMVDLTLNSDMAAYEKAMAAAIERFSAEGVTHHIFGDIFLDDVRSYREEKLKPYGIEVVEPLWGKTPREVMDEYLAAGLKTVIVTTMADLLRKEYIGRIVDRQLIDTLPDGVDICGENGEYHTLCFDGPIFNTPVRYELGEPFLFSNDVRMEDGSSKTFQYWFANIL